MTVRLKRDDGAVVYVNGVPVVRDNLPDGAITASTPASSFVSGAGESTWFEYQVPASLFHDGDNTIAAELHQADLNNADGVFDLELVARTATEANPPTTPAPTVVGTSFSTVTLAWSPSTDDQSVVGYLVRRNNQPVLFTTSTSFVDTGLTPSTTYAYDVLAVDSSGNASAPGSVNATTSDNLTLVKSGDPWSYLATNTDPGTAWRQPGFDSSSWPSGPSQLGWGNRGETTTVPTGTLTQYYVHHLNVPDPSSIPQLELRLKRDDGAAVYINGLEVVRNNLPTGTLTAGTYSSTRVTAADGTTWYDFTVPGSLLVAGDNVIAAEVHQDSKSDTRGVFDLELVRATPAETNPPTRPGPSVTNVTGTSVSLSWTASTDDAGILGYVVLRNGAPIAYTTATTLTDGALVAATDYGYQIIAVDTSGNESTPGSIAVSTTGSSALVQSGDVWRYKSDATDPGTAWRQPGFDASSWASGPSQLGWGNRGETTTVPSGTLTQYYLRHVTIADPSSMQQLTLRLKRDDGAAVYINGSEIVRDNLPTGTLTAGTYSSTRVTAADGTTWHEFTVPGTALVAGDNVIAAEVHQDSHSDTRSVFDLELSAAGPVAPVVTITSPADGGFAPAPTSISGLCTAAAGTVTVNVTGTQSGILTTPCTANEWSASTSLPDGTYNATATQTSGSTTGTSATVAFSVDSVAPVVTLDQPVAGALVGAPQVFTGTCTTSDGAVRATITGTAAASLTATCAAGTWSASTSVLVSGTYSATASQTDAAGNTGAAPAAAFGVDVTPPTTSDDTASIGNAWHTSATVHLTAVDSGGAGVAQTFYTTDGSAPTAASATGSTIDLDADGVYVIRYFSVDTLGNAEPIKNANTQIRIDQSGTAPVTTFPADGSRYNAAAWNAGCPTAGVCGTAADAGSGIASVAVTVQRQSDNQYWNGTAWQATSATLPATGTTSWSRALPTSALSNGVAYTVSAVATDGLGNQSPPTVSAFTYDTSGPTTSGANLVPTNKNGAVEVDDSFSVTFNEAINPASVPATATLTLSRATGNTSYGISGLTNGLRSTGTNGYLTSSFRTQTVTFAGTLALSSDARTVTFTVTGACAGTCSALAPTPRSGAFQFVAAPTLRDLAGNAPSTSTVTASSQVMF